MAQSTDQQPTTNPSNFGSGIANPANVYLTDAVYAVCTDAASTSDVSGFGNFGIPGAAKIVGIEVDCIGHYTGSGVNHDITVSIKGSGSFVSKNWTPPQTTDSTITLGTPSDLWGRTWTVADFANNTLTLEWGGADISVTSMSVDSYTARVFYTVNNGNILLMFKP